jgi:hypothetical protein
LHWDQTQNEGKLFKDMNIIDMQSLLESYACTIIDCKYTNSMVDFLVKRVEEATPPGTDSQFSNSLLTSLMKSLSALRIIKAPWEQLTSLIIKRLKSGRADDALIFFAC